MIQIKKLKNSKKTKKILYGQNLSLFKSTFLFTLAGDTPEEKFYCMCLVVDDFVEGRPGEYY